MAVSVVSVADARSTVSSFTMSLTQGWDRIPPERGGRLPEAGDLILLEVRSPRQVTGPSGWTYLGEFPWTDGDGRERTGRAFARIIAQGEVHPVFTTADPEPEWEIIGRALTGYAPAGGDL